MDLKTLKQKIVATVEASEDESLLQDTLSFLTDGSFDKNEAYYRNRLEESTQQADACKVLSPEILHSIMRQRILATVSLNEAWQNEDDEYWNTFLKD